MTQDPASAAPQEGAAPSPSAEALARALTGLAARLGELMVKETALLRAGRLGEIAVLQVEKKDLARAYAGRWAQLKADQAGASSLPQGLADALRAQVTRLAAATAENEKALRLMQNAVNRVLGIIAKAVREQRATMAGYNARRTRPRRTPEILGVSCDRSL